MTIEEQLSPSPNRATTSVIDTEVTARADESAATRTDAAWLHLAIIIPLAATIFLFRLGVADWRDTVDTHQGVIISHMVAGDGWVLPLRNGRHLPAKPPLYAWLGALSATLRGSPGDLLDGRLPSAAAALAETIVVYVAARAMAGGAVGLWSALILITTPQVIISGRDSRVDMLFSTLVTMAFMLVWRVWDGRAGRGVAALAGLCFGLAVLTKGPLALVLGGIVFGVAVVVTPPASGWRALFTPLSIGLAIGLPAAWYLAAAVEHGMAFIRLHVLAENVSRLVGGQDRSPVWYYLEPMLTMGLPWILALPAAILGTSAVPQRQRRFLWMWVGVMFTFFTLSLGKRRVYLLPLRPALAILLAGWLVPQLARWNSRVRTALPPPTVRAFIVGLVLALLAVAAALSAGIRGWGMHPEQWSYWWRLYVREYPVTVAVFALVIGVGIDQTLRALWQRRVERATLVFVIMLVVGTAIAISSDAIVRGQAVSMQPLAAQITAALAPGERLAFFATDDDDAVTLLFHLRRQVDVVESAHDHDSCIPPAAGAYLIQEKVWEARGCAADPAWHVVARGGPEVRNHRDQRMVFARYAAAPGTTS